MLRKIKLLICPLNIKLMRANVDKTLQFDQKGTAEGMEVYLFTSAHLITDLPGGNADEREADVGLYDWIWLVI